MSAHVGKTGANAKLPGIGKHRVCIHEGKAENSGPSNMYLIFF